MESVQTENGSARHNAEILNADADQEEKEKSRTEAYPKAFMIVAESGWDE